MMEHFLSFLGPLAIGAAGAVAVAVIAYGIGYFFGLGFWKAFNQTPIRSSWIAETWEIKR